MRYFFLLCLGITAFFLLYKNPETWVYDKASIFSESERQALDQYHQKLLEEHDIDYRILTVATSEKLSLYSYKAFQQLNVGTASTNGRGLLLVLDTSQNQVRLEVSTSLEPIFTDSFIAYLQSRQMVPYFTRGEIPSGLLATTEMIFSRAQEAEKGMEFMPPSQAISVGGGAETDANIGAGENAIPKYKTRQTLLQNTEGLTPTEIVNLYHQAMKNRDARSDLEIYSTKTRELIKSWAMTAGQMDNIAKTFANCTQQKQFIMLQLAVVRYGVEQRQCSPYFLVFEAGAWRLDFSTMYSLIKFNHNNQWHFKKNAVNLYSFGFGDWQFDKHRYPHAIDPSRLRWQFTVKTMYDQNTYVTWVNPDGPAHQLGFEYGDQIVSWVGETGFDYKTIIPLMNKLKPGDSFRAVVKRGGIPVQLSGVAPVYKN